ncbi:MULTISPECIES: TRAP transporter large permease [Alcaligenes]|jgi:tripartite ATP-independent transporter DctM subunit|uniref:TRAP transporter large permease protein n=1 Tax=Alcaligenes ammonioxydans TaxID=2582914 RepID=A0ABX8SUS4_9BURK|nr:TRAP transporter large permease subunit [Alcaligenes ammonioxydans]EJC61448.1 TRAP transporter large transmembrane protein [Alcaligenes faecalis subsp. faecalis NCIB 8687]QBH20571.1 TRAP transporter large permease subunit [Alcaligenes faecalis]QXX78643.1 TRAP transporter large permease subunit [Alcaligenes ammonioxydans]WGQ36772.1 TRAP transporter large permease subunit [Alcaligenes faecalis]HRK86543.1 TRAP transporter large permease subunit [Alcaligenes faecalis]
MTPELIALVMGGLLLLGLFMGHPLAFVLGSTAVIGALVAGKPMVLGIVVNRIYGDVLDNYTLIAIPLFILMARFLSDSEVTDKMFEALRLLMSRVRGGLALAVVFISILLAATTGIIGASITVTGMMALRPMLRYGYCPKLTTGVIAASGCLGILIPPSIMLILMASYSPLSIGELFAGALIPGVLLGLLYALWVVFVAWRHPERAPSVEPDEKISRPALIRMLLVEAVPPIFLILGILGSMLAGIATATEASAIGVLLSLLIVIFRGKFKWSIFLNALYETGRTSSMILFIVVGATAFTGVFNITGGLGAAQDIMRGLDMEPWLLIVVMLLIIFILGCFLDWTGIVLLSFPILLPIVQEMGISLLWFVILVSVVLQTSFLTPPFGYALFYLRAITPKSVKTMEIITGVIPFIGLIILMCILLAIFPGLATWLPTVLYGT